MAALILLAAAAASCPLPAGSTAETAGYGCTPAGEVLPFTLAPIALQTAAKRFFDMQLRDAPTARWRFVRSMPKTACGYVNAKNAFGAYSGWQPFEYSDGDGKIFADAPDWTFTLSCFGDTTAMKAHFKL